MMMMMIMMIVMMMKIHKIDKYTEKQREIDKDTEDRNII